MSSLVFKVSIVSYINFVTCIFINLHIISEFSLLDDSCPFKAEAENPKCWGYEANCTPDRQLFEPRCPGDSNGWTNNKQEQINKFWTQGDFGYVKERLSELRIYCKASKPGDSSLECVDHTRFCRGKNCTIKKKVKYRSIRFLNNFFMF